MCDSHTDARLGLRAKRRRGYGPFLAGALASVWNVWPRSGPAVTPAARRTGFGTQGTIGQRRSCMGELVCYCFGYSAADIENDIMENGTSTIMKRIADEKKIGGCQCATKNPEGR